MGDGWGYRASLVVRRLLPESVKLGWRAVRLLAMAAPASAPALPQHLLDDCRVLSDRLRMLDHVPQGGVICELGTLKGDYSRAILERTQPRALHLVDVTFEACAADVLAHPAVTRHEMLTTTYLAGCADECFDMIYVDADHSYAAVSADIAAAAPKVKRGGLLAFNDFARIIRPGLGQFGVHQAVCEFMARENWPMVFFCMNGEALYDVALRRPA